MWIAPVLGIELISRIHSDITVLAGLHSGKRALRFGQRRSRTRARIDAAVRTDGWAGKEFGDVRCARRLSEAAAKTDVFHWSPLKPELVSVGIEAEGVRGVAKAPIDGQLIGEGLVVQDRQVKFTENFRDMEPAGKRVVGSVAGEIIDGREIRVEYRLLFTVFRASVDLH